MTNNPIWPTVSLGEIILLPFNDVKLLKRAKYVFKIKDITDVSWERDLSTTCIVISQSLMKLWKTYPSEGTVYHT